MVLVPSGGGGGAGGIGLLDRFVFFDFLAVAMAFVY